MDFDWNSYEQEYETRILERSNFLQNALDYFQTNDVACADKAAEKISALYFAVKTMHVEEYIPERMNKFKMAALISFCIVKVQPLRILKSTPHEIRALNANLALSSALALINDMEVEKETTMSVLDNIQSIGNVGIEDSIINQLRNTEKWLASKDVNIFPIFSTGAFFHMVWLYSAFKLQHTGVSH